MRAGRVANGSGTVDVVVVEEEDDVDFDGVVAELVSAVEQAAAHASRPESTAARGPRNLTTVEYRLQSEHT